jgi:NitT/TauT family transport system permease protein
MSSADTTASFSRAKSRSRVSLRSRATKLVGPIFFFGVFIAFWQLVSSNISASKKVLVPGPGLVFRVGFWSSTVCNVEAAGKPTCQHVRTDILHALLQTSKEAALGLLIAVALGMTIAILMSQARWVERAIFPWAVALQTIPILALVPFIQIRYGFQFKSRVIVCVIIAVFPILTNTLFGLQSAEEGHHDLFTLHRGGRLRRLWKLQLPASLPAVFTGLRISAGLSVVGAIVGEYFFRRGEIGLGHMIDFYRGMRWKYDIPSLFSTVIYTCLLGVLVFVAFSVAGSLSTRSWYEPAGTARD